jgi:hypothetical protein
MVERLIQLIQSIVQVLVKGDGTPVLLFLRWDGVYDAILKQFIHIIKLFNVLLAHKKSPPSSVLEKRPSQKPISII